MPPNRRAFTLIELLVVIAIIALLIGILLPALGSARQAGQDVVCLANQRSIGQGMATYTTNNREWLPGPATSGFNYDSASNPVRNTPAGPVSNWDILSPLVGESLGFSPDRLQRFQQLLEDSDFRCPSNREEYIGVFRPQGLLPMDRAAGGDGPHPRILSYTAAPHFFVRSQVFPTLGEAQNAPQGILGFAPRGGLQPPGQWLATGLTPPPNYAPQITRVGNPSRKAILSESGRFWTTLNGKTGLDYTTSTRTSGFTGSPQGNFLAVAPYFNGNGPSGHTGLARENGKPSEQLSRIFLRHGGDTMNIPFFDGHVERLSEFELTDPTLWAPRGSTVWGDSRRGSSILVRGDEFEAGSKID
ncbi:MAG: prepilin-type N-terminal cleavage/methylation domain-containing protein [Planctomycetota bacterium]